jgi:hypothetical protein
MSNAIMPNAIMPNAIMPNATMPNAITPNAIMPNAMMLNMDPQVLQYIFGYLDFSKFGQNFLNNIDSLFFKMN